MQQEGRLKGGKGNWKTIETAYRTSERQQSEDALLNSTFGVQSLTSVAASTFFNARPSKNNNWKRIEDPLNWLRQMEHTIRFRWKRVEIRTLMTPQRNRFTGHTTGTKGHNDGAGNICYWRCIRENPKLWWDGMYYARQENCLSVLGGRRRGKSIAAKR